MNNDQRQFQNKQTDKLGFNINNEQAVQQPVAQEYPDPQNYIPEAATKKRGKSKADRKLKLTGLVLAGLVIAGVFLMPTSPSVNTSDEANQALVSGMSTQLPIGVRILTDDQYVAGRDLTITHSSPNAENKIHIWDYAAEDGDYVQVLVDGVAICDPFMIKNKTVVFDVPTTGEVQILGTHDGGGGITYAVHYDVNGTTYFNGTDVGDGNLYTLIRE